MKKFNKMLVVLPLVLVFVLSSLPVFGWAAADKKLTVQIKHGDDPVVSKVYVVATDIPEDKYTDGIGNVKVDDIRKTILAGTVYAAGVENGQLLLDEAEFNAIVKAIKSMTDDTTLELKITDAPKEKTYKCAALNDLAKPYIDVVWTEMHELTNKAGANSWNDRAHEYYNWEVARNNKLKDYYLVGWAPDDNANISDLEASIMQELGVDLIIWVAEKTQPLRVTHVFPNRDPLFETIGVDYYVLMNNQINNYNAAEIAKTRIQKMNELGYVFEKAEYVPFEKREGLLKIARDEYGQALPTTLILKGNGIFIYYKGAPIPAPVPVVDSQKKVDAATAQTPAQTGALNTNVQANVQAPAAPVTAAGQQLPATGVADNAFLFLSSAALMALGIFFFKKH